MLKTESYKKGLVFSIVFNAAAKALSFFTIIIIAFYFGSDSLTDVYFFTYNIILFIATFITQLNGAVIIPESMRMRLQEGETGAMHFINFFMVCIFSLGAMVSILIIIDPVYFFSLVSHFDQKVLDSSKTLLLGISVLLPLIMVVNFLTEITTSYKFFTMPMLASAVTSLLSIASMIFGHGTFGIGSIPIGLGAAYFINLVLLISFMRKKLHWSFVPRLPRKLHLWKSIYFATAGNSFSVASSYIGMLLLSGFSAGTLSALNFAQRVYEVPTSFVTNQFGSIAAIKLNEVYPKGELDEFNSVFINSVTFLIILLFPMTVFFFYFPSEILSILFQRGNFSTASVEKSAEMLRVLGLMLPLLAVNILVSRVLMATQRIDISFKNQITIAALIIGLTFLGVRLYGEVGYPIAQVTGYALGMFVNYYVLRVAARFVRYSEVLKAMLIIGTLNLAISYCTIRIVMLFEVSGILKMAIFASIFGPTYLLVLYFTRYREIFGRLKFKL